ncbi:AAA family ATPase, partial [Klebsiella michiganensis]|nr:AAA family ATPase [Klebsiella michiganensis]
MKINFIEIKNFRKLKSVRIDIAEKTTLFVGANNSGKTAAMEALGHFLVDASRF